MKKDKKHIISRISMWSSVVIAGISVIGILPRYPVLGLVLFVISAITTVISAIFKKRYCPQCRTKSPCTIVASNNNE